MTFRSNEHQILILSPSDDGHCALISKYLNKHFGVRVVTLDTALLSREYYLTFTPDNNSLIFRSTRLKEIVVDDKTICWWRRPADPILPSEVKNLEIARFCRREYAFTTIGALLASAKVIVNDPKNEREARHKSLQLSIASKVGLNVPNTLISSDSSDIKMFLKRTEKKMIFKASHSPHWQLIDTRLLEDKMIQEFHSLRFSPIIVQEFIEGRDLRAAVFGDQVYAFEVKINKKSNNIDWRVNVETSWQPIKLTESLEIQLKSLLAGLGLSYGIIDLRESATGEPYFLEVNPSGQFLFLDQELLAKAFCEYLLSFI